MKGKTEVAKEIAKKHGSRDLIVILGGGGVVKNQETTMSIAESNGKHGVITLSVDSCVFDPLSKVSKEIPIVHNKTAEAFSEELMNSLRSVASKREIKNPFKEDDGCQLSSRDPSFNNTNSLISGKEAKLAWASGDTVGYIADGKLWIIDESTPLGVFESFSDWQVKPRTISINGIELPASFEPKEGDVYFYLNNFYECGYDSRIHKSEPRMFYHTQAWQTEDEIKQVVKALRSVLGGKQ